VRSAAIAVIMAVRHEPFVLGKSDCLTFALSVAAAVTGSDPYAGRPRYTTMAHAVRLLKRHGFNCIGDGFAAVWQEIPPSFATLGDIGVLKEDAAVGMAAVVHDGNGWLARNDPKGLVRKPMSSVARAFRVI
jgi:hypothetical protein